MRAGLDKLIEVLQYAREAISLYILGDEPDPYVVWGMRIVLYDDWA